VITIHARGGQRLSDLTRHLIALAGGDKRAVTSGGGGLVVADELAYAYLSAQFAPPTPAPQLAPPAVAKAVRDVEDRGGLSAPREEPTRPPQKRSKQPVRRNARKEFAQ
jgi:hypothetical protein